MFNPGRGRQLHLKKKKKSRFRSPLSPMSLGSQACAGTSSLVSLPLSSPPAVPSPSSSQKMVLNHRSDHVSSLLKCCTGLPPISLRGKVRILRKPCIPPPLLPPTRPPPWTLRPALLSLLGHPPLSLFQPFFKCHLLSEAFYDPRASFYFTFTSIWHI